MPAESNSSLSRCPSCLQTDEQHGDAAAAEPHVGGRDGAGGAGGGEAWPGVGRPWRVGPQDGVRGPDHLRRGRRGKGRLLSRVVV